MPAKQKKMFLIVAYCFVFLIEDQEQVNENAYVNSSCKRSKLLSQ